MVGREGNEVWLRAGGKGKEGKMKQERLRLRDGAKANKV
jgi:hypothetical protein